MRFVHLAPRQAADRIRRNGLRKGDGRRGRGVYAVPLFRLPLRTWKRPDDWKCEEVDLSDPVSSSRLWRPLFRMGAERRHQGLAVVFSAPAASWPLDLYLTVPPEVTLRLLDAMEGEGLDGVHLSCPAHRAAREAAAGSFLADLELSVADAGALGRMVRLYVESGAAPWAEWDDVVEVVFRRPIPPGCVHRLIPLHRSGGRFRVDKERAAGEAALRAAADDDGEEAYGDGG
jgi:hypothetical protein